MDRLHPRREPGILEPEVNGMLLGSDRDSSQDDGYRWEISIFIFFVGRFVRLCMRCDADPAA
jgi:hypothetical protein